MEHIVGTCFACKSLNIALLRYRPQSNTILVSQLFFMTHVNKENKWCKKSTETQNCIVVLGSQQLHIHIQEIFCQSRFKAEKRNKTFTLSLGNRQISVARKHLLSCIHSFAKIIRMIRNKDPET